MEKRFRFTAIIPFVFSIVAFALLIVLERAGTSVGNGQDYYLLSLNTSKIGSGTIQFNPVSDPTPSIGDPTGILDGLADGLNGILTNLTGDVDDSLQNLEASIITNATEALGIHDVYSIYLQNICEADSTNGSFSACPTLAETTDGINNVTTNIPSYFVVGTTNVSIPLLAAVGTSFGSIQDYITVATQANLAFIFIGLISSGLVAILSLVAIFLSGSRLVVLLTLGFALLAPFSLIISALVTTIIIHFIVAAVNGLGSALTISATAGGPAIALAWVSWALSVGSSVYWFLIWFVNFRQTAFVRRQRTESEIGNWGATFRGTKERLKVEKSVPL